MVKSGVSEESAVEQTSLLASFPATVLPCLASSSCGDKPLPLQIETEPTSHQEEDVPQLPALEDEPKHTVATVPDFPLGTYVVSVQRRGAFKRLHCIGSCARLPGRDYAC